MAALTRKRPTCNRHYFRDGENRTVCPWKGVASYYDLDVDDQINRGAAWYYPEPKPAARYIKGYVAFWRGVQVEATAEKAPSGLLDRT